MKKVVICEDHHIVYDGLNLLLSESLDYQMAGHAATGKELLPLLKKTKPDILILDLNLPDTDGFVLLKEIRKHDKQIQILILTMYKDPFLIQKAKKEGANGYILKNTANKELLIALSSLHTDFFVSKAIQHEMDARKMFNDRFANKFKLTPRETEIVKSLAIGNTNLEIAKEFFLSPSTVETHRKNIWRKLGINNLAQLIRFAHDNKIL